MTLPSITDRFVQLALTPQLGWAQIGMRPAETIYEHSLDMAQLAHRLTAQHYPELDATRMFEMCMSHGMSELMWAGQIRANRQTDNKLAAMEAIAAATQPSRELDRVVELFTEYHEKKTPLAKLAHDFDSLQAAQQCLRYEQAIPSANLQWVWQFQQHKIEDLTLKSAFFALASQRPANAAQRADVEPITLTNKDVEAVRVETVQRVNIAAVRAERAAAFAGAIYRP